MNIYFGGNPQSKHLHVHLKMKKLKRIKVTGIDLLCEAFCDVSCQTSVLRCDQKLFQGVCELFLEAHIKYTGAEPVIVIWEMLPNGG